MDISRLEKAKPRRLRGDNGEWSLELELLVPINRRVFRPTIRTIRGREQILWHLERLPSADLLYESAERLMNDPPGPKAFEARGGQWTPAAPPGASRLLNSRRPSPLSLPPPAVIAAEPTDELGEGPTSQRSPSPADLYHQQTRLERRINQLECSPPPYADQMRELIEESARLRQRIVHLESYIQQMGKGPPPAASPEAAASPGRAGGADGAHGADVSPAAVDAGGGASSPAASPAPAAVVAAAAATPDAAPVAPAEDAQPAGAAPGPVEAAPKTAASPGAAVDAATATPDSPEPIAEAASPGEAAPPGEAAGPGEADPVAAVEASPEAERAPADQPPVQPGVGISEDDVPAALMGDAPEDHPAEEPPPAPREPLRMPEVEALHSALQTLVGDKVGLKAAPDATPLDPSSPDLFLSNLIADDGQIIGAMISDKKCAVNLGSSLLMMPVYDIDEQMADAEVVEEAVDAMSEIFNTLSGQINNVPKNPHIKTSVLKAVDASTDAWIQGPKLRLDLEDNIGGRMILVTRP